MEDNKDLVKVNVGDEVISRIDTLCKVGFTMPADYNYINAIKAAMLVLADVKNKNGVPALQCCTKNSIQTALFKMATKGLDVSKKQGYLLIRGDQLCFEESYFGTCLQARRASQYFEPIANIIYKGDVFKFEIDPNTGRKKVLEHTQTLESIDSGEMVGAYAYVTNDKGETDIEIMTMAQIRKSWSKSSSQQQLVHKEFPDQMARRTVIKRAAKMLINSSKSVVDDDLEEAVLNPTDASHQIETEYATFEEVHDEIPANEPKEVAYKEQADASKKSGRRPKANPEPTPEPAPADPPIQENNEGEEF